MFGVRMCSSKQIHFFFDLPSSELLNDQQWSYLKGFDALDFRKLPLVVNATSLNTVTLIHLLQTLLFKSVVISIMISSRLRLIVAPNMRRLFM